jgi:transposase
MIEASQRRGHDVTVIEYLNDYPTNNVAERALRPAVLWRKGSFGSDSEAGCRFAERLLTVVASCHQQGRPLLAFLAATGEAALHGTAQPSLLPAGQGG